MASGAEYRKFRSKISRASLGVNIWSLELYQPLQATKIKNNCTSRYFLYYMGNSYSIFCTVSGRRLYRPAQRER